MKKIFTILIVFILSCAFVSAKDYSLNFNGKHYKLLYSAKSKDFGGYINEYYKHGETYNLWTDMVAVHHFPNAYSPISRIKDFREYLTSIGCPSSLTFDERHNSAIIDFVAINDKRVPIILEFNIFKYEKSEKCGSRALQYAKRYAATNALQQEQIMRDFEKNRKRMVRKVKRYKIPKVITEDIDKCKVEYTPEPDKTPQKEDVKPAEKQEAVSDSPVSEDLQEGAAENKNVTEETSSQKEDEVNAGDTKKEEVTENVADKKEEVSEKAVVKEDKQSGKEEIATEEKSVESKKKAKDDKKDNNEIKSAPVADESAKEANTEDNVSNSVENKDKTVKKKNKKEKVKQEKPNKKEKVAKPEKTVKKEKPSKPEKTVKSDKPVKQEKPAKKEKVSKRDSYQVVNTKDEYYRRSNKTRTVKKTKEKPYQVVNTKDEYYTKREKYRKVTKKDAKKRAKKSSKVLSE